RLTDTPAIVTTDADEMSTQMAKLFAAAGQSVPEVKYIFELNPLFKLRFILGIGSAFNQHMIRVELKDVFHFRHGLTSRGE
ncbi:hypothetical protein KU440_25300, partial [Salmonella enterica subsp. enterica serovar Reading]|nr:hypothetical protein [Salmonella enterica subsp. enterica serovar Reading]